MREPQFGGARMNNKLPSLNEPVQVNKICSNKMPHRQHILLSSRYRLEVNMLFVSRWAMAEGYGACLINKPELVRDMVRLVRNQVDNHNYSVSIKIR